MEIPEILVFLLDDELIEFIGLDCVLEGKFVEEEGEEDDSQCKDVTLVSMVGFASGLSEMDLWSHVSLPSALELGEENGLGVFLKA